MNNKEKLCPYCSESIAYGAKKCKHCGERLDDEEKEKHQSQSDKLISQVKPLAKLYLILSAIVFIIGVAVFYIIWNNMRNNVSKQFDGIGLPFVMTKDSLEVHNLENASQSNVNNRLAE